MAGRTNRLLQRVQRHANLSVLFRRAGASRATRPTPVSSAGGPLVRATTLPDFVNGQPAEQLPFGETMPAEMAAPASMVDAAATPSAGEAIQRQIAQAEQFSSVTPAGPAITPPVQRAESPLVRPPGQLPGISTSIAPASPTAPPATASTTPPLPAVPTGPTPAAAASPAIQAVPVPIQRAESPLVRDPQQLPGLSAPAAGAAPGPTPATSGPVIQRSPVQPPAAPPPVGQPVLPAPLAPSITEQRSVAPPTVPSAPVTPAQPATGPQPRDPAQPLQTAPVQRQADGPSAPPAAGPPAAADTPAPAAPYRPDPYSMMPVEDPNATIEDPNVWNRLSNIMRKHQEQPADAPTRRAKPEAPWLQRAVEEHQERMQRTPRRKSPSERSADVQREIERPVQPRGPRRSEFTYLTGQPPGTTPPLPGLPGTPAASPPLQRQPEEEPVAEPPVAEPPTAPEELPGETQPAALAGSAPPALPAAAADQAAPPVQRLAGPEQTPAADTPATPGAVAAQPPATQLQRQAEPAPVAATETDPAGQVVAAETSGAASPQDAAAAIAAAESAPAADVPSPTAAVQRQPAEVAANTPAGEPGLTTPLAGQDVTVQRQAEPGQPAVAGSPTVSEPEHIIEPAEQPLRPAADVAEQIQRQPDETAAPPMAAPDVSAAIARAEASPVADMPSATAPAAPAASAGGLASAAPTMPEAGATGTPGAVQRTTGPDRASSEPNTPVAAPLPPPAAGETTVIARQVDAGPSMGESWPTEQTATPPATTAAAAPLAETPPAAVSEVPVVRATTAPLQRQPEPAGTEPVPASEPAATTPPIAIQRVVDSPAQPVPVAQSEIVSDAPAALPAAEQAPTTPITAATTPQVSRQAEGTAAPAGATPVAGQPVPSPAAPAIGQPTAMSEPTPASQPTADLSELATIVQRVPQTPAAPPVAAPPARAEAPVDNRPSLESIWPVERIAGPGEEDEYKPPPPQPPALRLDQEKDVIRRALADVQPGEGTRAKVDLQLPRRGRPQRAPDAPPPPAPRQQPENHFPAPGSAAAPTLAPAAPVAIQRAVAQAESPARPELVQTEVGALPADLWGYLGERAPIDTQATQHRSNDLMRFFDRAQPAGRQMGDVLPPQIQRAVEIDEIETRVEQSPADEGRADDEGAAEPDIDKLAEQVYAELKRRLRLEWERAHGRFR